MDKSKVINELITIKQQVISNLTSVRSYYNDAADLEEGTTMDLEDFSHQGEWAESARLVDGQISIAENTLSTLEKMPTLRKEIVEVGTIIKLKGNAKYILCGINYPNTTLEDGTKIIGVSESAPIYKKIDGLKKNDAFELNGKSFVIEELH